MINTVQKKLPPLPRQELRDSHLSWSEPSGGLCASRAQADEMDDCGHNGDEEQDVNRERRGVIGHEPEQPGHQSEEREQEQHSSTSFVNEAASTRAAVCG